MREATAAVLRHLADREGVTSSALGLGWLWPRFPGADPEAVNEAILEFTEEGAHL